MSDQMRSLALAMEQASDLLLEYGRTEKATDLLALALDIRSGDNKAIVRSVSEATGGAGSLNDQSLCPAVAADDRLRKLIGQIENLARSIANERSIRLVR